MSWVPYWDDSFDQVTDFKAMYDAGYRVMAGYVAGGSSGKWSSADRIKRWLAMGPDTGFFPLFEAVGDEPVSNPGSGDDHARSARLGARARGIPDSVSISPAMDRNVSSAQWHNQLVTYFGAWAKADSAKPIPYVEADAGQYLQDQGISAGTFTPAAYAWNDPAVLYTPSNAPAHVVATQEHNGRKMAGGTADIGHIRTSANIWWITTEEDMALTAADVKTIITADNVGLDNPAYRADSPDHNPAPAQPNPQITLNTMLGSIAGQANSANVNTASVLKAVTDLQAAVAKLPTTAAPAAPIDLDALAAKVADLLAARLQS